MWSVTLAGQPGREGLKGFGVAMGLLGGGGVAGACVIAGVPSGAAALLGSAVAVIVGTVAWLRPHRMEGPYGWWNRLARAYARRARAAVIAIAFYTVVAAAGITGGSLALGAHQSAASRWTPRTTLPPEDYPGQGSGLRSTGSGPLGDLGRWALRTGHWWTIFLIPFLALIAAFDVRDSTPPPDSIYTLY